MPVKWLVAVVGLIVLVVAAALVMSGRSSETAPQDLRSPHVVAPLDADLVVGATTVPQVQGSCVEKGACRYITPEPLPAVAVTVGQDVSVKAGQSRQFNFAVGAGPSPVPVLKVVDDKLLVSAATPGTWQVTVAGNAGGVWMMQLTVNQAPTPPEPAPKVKKK